MNPEKRPITVEDLLRLKRAERPPAEFWEAFDRELRAKQLAALVEKRPWWRSLPNVFAGLARYRYHLPIGATAVLAITFLATREQETATPPSAPAAAKVAVVESSSRGETVSGPVLVTIERTTGSAATEAAVTDETISTPTAAALAASAVEPVLTDESENAMPARHQLDTPSSRFIAENLKAAQAAEPAIARSLLSRSQGFENRGLTAKVAMVEPLTRMTPPTNSRFAKLNSVLLNNASFKADGSAVTSERAASRLSEDQLYDRISRFRANGGNHGIGLDTRL